MRNAVGVPSARCTVAQSALILSADLSGKGVDAKGNPLPGSDGYKQMVTPSYMFGPEETIHPWRALTVASRSRSTCRSPPRYGGEERMPGLRQSAPYARRPRHQSEDLLGPDAVLQSESGRRDPTVAAYRVRCSLAQLDDQRSSDARGLVARTGARFRILPDRALARLAAFLLVGKPFSRHGGAGACKSRNPR